MVLIYISLSVDPVQSASPSFLLCGIFIIVWTITRPHSLQSRCDKRTDRTPFECVQLTSARDGPRFTPNRETHIPSQALVFIYIAISVDAIRSASPNIWYLYGSSFSVRTTMCPHSLPSGWPHFKSIQCNCPYHCAFHISSWRGFWGFPGRASPF